MPRRTTFKFLQELAYAPVIDIGEEPHVEVNVQVKENGSGAKHADVAVK